MLSIKQPKVPEITDILIAIIGSGITPNKNEAIPIIPAPTIAAEVPKIDIAPSVPAGTFLNVVIKRGSWRTPISLANVSAVAVATAPMNPPVHALEKEMATHSSVLAWRIPGTEKPGGLRSMGSHRVGHD